MEPSVRIAVFLAALVLWHWALKGRTSTGTSAGSVDQTSAQSPTDDDSPTPQQLFQQPQQTNPQLPFIPPDPITDDPDDYDDMTDMDDGEASAGASNWTDDYGPPDYPDATGDGTTTAAETDGEIEV